jgi:hypothetical protein
MTLPFPFFFYDTTRFISPGHTAAGPKMSVLWIFAVLAACMLAIPGLLHGVFVYIGVQRSGLANDFDDVAIVVGQGGNCP